MSWVAEAKAAMINSTKVSVNMLIGVCPLSISSGEGLGSVTVSRTRNAVIIICMQTIHQRLVLITSTKGLQIPLSSHGKYSSVVKKAISPLGTPIFVNIITEMLFTTK